MSPEELDRRICQQASKPGHRSTLKCPYTGRWCRCRASCALDRKRAEDLEIDPERDGVRIVKPWERDRRSG